MTAKIHTLDELGWRGFFAAQVRADETDLVPARVLGVHRSAVVVAGPGIDTTLPPLRAADDAGICLS